MTEFKIRIADIPISVKANYEFTKNYCRDYLTDEDGIFEVIITKDDIEKERIIAEKHNLDEGEKVVDYSDELHETTALYRKVLEELIKHDAIMLHGSVVAVDGRAYLFTANSGTGKTTHTRLWLENIEGSYILNGDKPIILFRDNKAFACGTPWRGKENCGVNEILPLSGICILERGEKNSIEKISFKDAFNILMMQSYHPSRNNGTLLSMQLIQKLNSVNTFRLKCNMDREAAFVSYDAMSKKETTTFEEVLNSTGKLLYKNVGVSMMPLIREGKDIMIIEKEPLNNLKKLDAVLFTRPGVIGRGAYVLHRILKVNKDGTYWIVGDHCFGGETVKRENIIGVLTGVVRDGKTISINDKNYKFYVHLWCDLYPIRFIILRIKYFFKYPKYVSNIILGRMYQKYKKIQSKFRK